MDNIEEEAAPSVRRIVRGKRETMCFREAQENFEARLLPPNYELTNAIERECSCDP